MLKQFNKSKQFSTITLTYLATAEVDLDELAEPAGVVVPQRFRVPEGLENGIG
jgi:hypothetical protein